MKPYHLVAGISLAVLLNLLQPFGDRPYAMADSKSLANQGAETDAVKKLLSPDADTIDAGIDEIKAERKRQIDALLPLIDSANLKKYSPRTRAAAAYLLGEMRASEAVNLLAQRFASGNEPDLRSMYDMNRLDAPFWTALVEIGRPSVPALLDLVQKTDDKDIRFQTLMALDHILGGKAHVAETLAKLKAKAAADAGAEAKEKVARLDAAISDLRVKFTE
jgi:predicted DNA-binding ribbon-helix-helix protein